MAVATPPTSTQLVDPRSCHEMYERNMDKGKSVAVEGVSAIGERQETDRLTTSYRHKCAAQGHFLDSCSFGHHGVAVTGA